jgi:hypothetical protein
MGPLRAESAAENGGILVSRELVGDGGSHRLARLTRILRLDFASCSWCLLVSAKKSASILRSAVNLSVTESLAFVLLARYQPAISDTFVATPLAAEVLL